MQFLHARGRVPSIEQKPFNTPKWAEQLVRQRAPIASSICWALSRECETRLPYAWHMAASVRPAAHEAGLFVQPDDDVADLVRDVRLNSLGRLVENQERWREHQLPANGELLLLPSSRTAP